jgi:hypothetical protein
MFTGNGCRHPKVQVLRESVSSRHPPDLIDEFAEDLAYSLAAEFPNKDMAAKLRTLVRSRNEMDPNVRRLLAKKLHALARRASGYANQLTTELDMITELEVIAEPEGMVMIKRDAMTDPAVMTDGEAIVDA